MSSTIRAFDRARRIVRDARGGLVTTIATGAAPAIAGIVAPGSGWPVVATVVSGAVATQVARIRAEPGMTLRAYDRVRRALPGARRDVVSGLLVGLATGTTEIVAPGTGWGLAVAAVATAIAAQASRPRTAREILQQTRDFARSRTMSGGAGIRDVVSKLLGAQQELTDAESSLGVVESQLAKARNMFTDTTDGSRNQDVTDASNRYGEAGPWFPYARTFISDAADKINEYIYSITR